MRSLRVQRAIKLCERIKIWRETTVPRSSLKCWHSWASIAGKLLRALDSFIANHHIGYQQKPPDRHHSLVVWQYCELWSMDPPQEFHSRKRRRQETGPGWLGMAPKEHTQVTKYPLVHLMPKLFWADLVPPTSSWWLFLSCNTPSFLILNLNINLILKQMPCVRRDE
jgi:hypothetical protein